MPEGMTEEIVKRIIDRLEWIQDELQEQLEEFKMIYRLYGQENAKVMIDTITDQLKYVKEEVDTMYLLAEMFVY